MDGMGGRGHGGRMIIGPEKLIPPHGGYRKLKGLQVVQAASML